ncbi:transcription elongation factor S-II [Ascosphaera apis ARSEF 7405]|uniref:Transcription elongation factor n=1 Tax=Ascosphaera apis ARSEF 7405 TaxID=392613 RepID=A0A167W4K3_9EURO|nr:transcription elongation factor S-II [Ascosphaera apis ARSEF 7405]
MDAKAIEAKLKLLQKAVGDNEPTSTIISILEELKRGVKPTEQILRQTRVGVIVNKLRQHKTPEVQTFAGEIVSRWRNEVNRQKANSRAGSASSNGTAAGGAGAGLTNAGSSTTSSSRQVTSSPKPAALNSINTDEKLDKCTVAPDKRDYKADGINVQLTGDETRDACIGMMYNGLCLYRQDPPRVILQLAASIEAAGFKHIGKGSLTKEYRLRMRALFLNLKNKSNPGLRVRVIKGEFTPEQFVKATNEELMSDERRELEKKYHQENMNRAMVAKQERSISSSLQCGKCGQRKVTYTEAQTRSADEPMTLFCTCMNCGKTWKQ